MIDEPKPITQDAPRAPVVYFDGISAFNNFNGIVSLTLVMSIPVPFNDGTAPGKLTDVAHLRCNLAAAIALKDAIEKAMLAGVVPAGSRQ